MSLTVRDQVDPERTLDMGVTVDEAVSFIVEALEDPLKPRWCGQSIVACMVVIQLDHNSAESLINKNHLFGATIVAFLTAKRSIADIETLESTWSNCKCSYDAMTNHGGAVPVHHLVAGICPILEKFAASPNNRGRGMGRMGRFGDNALKMVADRFAQFFVDAVSKVKPFSVAKGRHPEIWPPTPKDLIPFGPETTVESLVMWSRFMRSAHVFSLVRFFMHVCGPVIVPAIVASRSAPKYMIEHGLQICSDAFSASLDANGQLDNGTVKTFKTEFEYILSFLSGILTIQPLLSRDLHFGIANKAFDFATRAIMIAESPTIPESYRPFMKAAVERLARYGSTLCTMMPEQLTVPKARIHPAILSVMDRMATPSVPAEFAYDMMRHARTIQSCFMPGCPESAQSSGRVYMRCSGCRIVAYHSKECQTRAWTHKSLPHRDICKKMKQVYDVAGDYLHRAEDQEKFVREMKRAKIRDAMLKEIGIWLSAAYTNLQRPGPFLTADARKYLSRKKGPIYAEGMQEFLVKVQSSLLSNPKRRKAGGK